MLSTVLLFTIAAIGWEIYSVGGHGESVLVEWSNGIGRNNSIGEYSRASNDDSALSDVSTTAMILFASIPFVTYAATTMSFLRHRRWAYVVMALLQIAVLAGVAIPVVVRIAT
jgi:cation transporter-like permease